jgi:hypothetical protein
MLNSIRKQKSIVAEGKKLFRFRNIIREAFFYTFENDGPLGGQNGLNRRKGGLEGRKRVFCANGATQAVSFRLKWSQSIIFHGLSRRLPTVYDVQVVGKSKRQRGRGRSPAIQNRAQSISYRILPKQTDNLPIFWKATGFMFRVNLFAVYADSEYPAGAGYEFNQFNLDTKFLFQFVLQTGGSGLIVSRSAVFNGDFHRFLLVVKKESR